MRVACVLIPSFAVAVERRSEPRLEGQQIVVFDQHGVVDADAPGVRRGQTLRQAKALAPKAVFRQADYARCRLVSEALLDALELVAPVVEEAALGCAFAEVGGLQGHYEDELALAGALIASVRDATGLLAGAGIASGKFAAHVAASTVSAGEAGAVPEGREQVFLKDKDVALLPVPREVVQRLDLLALRTLGDVAALPRPSLEAQFRSDGRRIWELANGIDGQPLRPRTRQELLSERLSFESPVVAGEALVAAGRQAITRLVRRLRGRTARRMHVQLLAGGRIVWEKLETFREPTGDDRTMLLLIKTRLALLELTEPVDTVAITLSGIGREVAKQAKLFTEGQQNLDQIAEAIRQLRARYGRPVVWRIEEVDPWSRHPEERRVLVPYDA